MNVPTVNATTTTCRRYSLVATTTTTTTLYNLLGCVPCCGGGLVVTQGTTTGLCGIENSYFFIQIYTPSHVCVWINIHNPSHNNTWDYISGTFAENMLLTINFLICIWIRIINHFCYPINMRPVTYKHALQEQHIQNKLQLVNPFVKLFVKTAWW